MRTWLFAVVGMALLATAGCRSDPAIAILERQLFNQEREIGRLRGELQDREAECEDHAVRTTSRGSRDEDAEPETPRKRRSSAATNGAAPPQVELPSQPTDNVPDALKSPAGLLPPGLEVPENLRGPSKPIPPQNKHTRSSVPSESDGPSLEGDSRGAGSRSARVTTASQLASAVPVTASDDSRRVAGIALNRELTGGLSAGDLPGDQGLLVVVEPRDNRGRTVVAPGDVSIVALDETKQGDAALVARWDFKAPETASLFRRTGTAGTAIHLAMAWPDEPPTQNKLHLYVRYVTRDGRKLETDSRIEVALPRDKTADWSSSDRPVEQTAETAPPRRIEPSDEDVPAPIPSYSASETSVTPQVADRRDSPKSRRPVWSPERRARVLDPSP